MPTKHSQIFYLGVLLSAVLVALTGGNARSQPQNNPVSAQPGVELLNLPIPPITGPGYTDGNIAQAFQIGNRRGRDPFRKQTRRQFQNADTNGGNSNYLLTVPILSLPGRGLSVNLNLYYNSQIWTNQGGGGSPYFVFDHDLDRPAPGWSLGFGKVVQVGLHQGLLVDADGTPHKFAPCQVTNLPNEFFQCTTQTTDGSLIDYTTITGPAGLANATAKYPNGTSVVYRAGSANALYPTQITDANGNFILIQYFQQSLKCPNAAPTLETRIQSITDTLGRVVNFEYDPNSCPPEHWHQPTAITAPGLGGSVRTVAQFYYKTITLGYSFVAPPNPSPEAETVIYGIYFPGTSTGYWFGDPDSYSTYGILSKVSQRRAMTIDDQGHLTPAK